MTISITITGIEQGLALITSKLQKLATVGSAVFPQAGQEMVSQMQARAPVKTGYLRSQIMVTQANNQILQIISGAPYSAFIIYGTWRMPGRDYFFSVAYPMMAQLGQRMAAYINAG
jgi:hypothetical protein